MSSVDGIMFCLSIAVLVVFFVGLGYELFKKRDVNVGGDE